MPQVLLLAWSRWLSEREVTKPIASRFAAVTGRFQPFHLGHLELVRIAAQQCDELIIGITNPDPESWREHADSVHRHLSASNPFTYWERHRMIEATLVDAISEGWLPENGWTIVPFPIDRPEVWFDYIPREATQFVRAFSDWERSKARMLGAGGYQVTLLEGDPDTVLRASSIRTAWERGESADGDLPQSARQVISRIRTGSDVVGSATHDPQVWTTAI